MDLIDIDGLVDRLTADIIKNDDDNFLTKLNNSFQAASISTEVEKKKSTDDLSTKILPDYDAFADTYIEVEDDRLEEGMRRLHGMALLENDKSCVENRYFMGSDFMARDKIVNERQSKRTLKKQRRKEGGQDAGKKWFNMKAPEMTEEIKTDLKVIKMRHVIDPKRFYKTPGTKDLPKYFQMGRIVSHQADYYSSRVPKNEKKARLADVLMEDAKFQQYRKRKLTEIHAKQAAKGGTKRFKRNRLLEKKNKTN